MSKHERDEPTSAEDPGSTDEGRPGRHRAPEVPEVLESFGIDADWRPEMFEDGASYDRE